MSLKQHTQTIFRQQFDRESDITIKAPGRVNLIGEHTDYNDGFVLPCAINYETVISCGKRDDRQIRVIAADYENQQDIFSLDAPIVPHPEYRWADYVRGVVKHLQMRNADFWWGRSGYLWQCPAGCWPQFLCIVGSGRGPSPAITLSTPS